MTAVAFQVLCRDGSALAAMHFASMGPSRGHVVVAGGLGVRQRFYTPFAQWLAAQGWEVYSFDPRGIGDSRSPLHARSLRGLNVDLLAWARDDFAAVVKHVAKRAADGRVALVGHSLGLHHALMSTPETQARLRIAVGVAAGSGYWRDWAPPSRRKARLLLQGVGPLSLALFGWFPGRRLGVLNDLPGPVMRQWMRWCRHPEFAWGAEPERLQASVRSARFPFMHSASAMTTP